MRTQTSLRAKSARALAAAGVATTVTTALATAGVRAATDVPQSPTSTDGGISAQLTSGSMLAYGRPVVVTGAAPAGAPTRLALEYSATGNAPWRTMAATTTGRNGRYRLTTALTRSGVVRVAVATADGATSASSAAGPFGVSSIGAGLAAAPALLPAALASAPLSVHVDTAIGITSEDLQILAGQRATVAGVVHPMQAGVSVALQARRVGRWATVAGTRTRGGGRYRLSYIPASGTVLRLRVGADAPDLPSTRVAGDLDVFHVAVASWYGPGGMTACGEELTASTLGVANKTLPCGTMVTLRYDGRTVRVPVIDRGPFVPGRDFDLTFATKQALAFGGVADVWANVI